MPDSVTVIYRKLAAEDFLTSDTPDQVTATVLGVGDVLVTPLVLAAGDVAAGVAGVNVGEVYVSSAVTPNRLRVRLT